MKKKHIWILFIFTKFFYMFIAIAFISKVTTLGDTFDYFYLTKPQEGSFPLLLLNSTYWMNLLGHNLYLIMGEYLANIPFIFLSVYGIYYPIKKMKLTTKQLAFLLILLSFPSFGIWTSICSKESVGVFFMGIILGYIIDLFEKRRKYPNLLELFAFYLLLIFKTQYAPAVFAIIIFIKLSQAFHLRKNGKFFLFIFSIIFVLILAYIVRDYMQFIADIMPTHFSAHSKSTRENTIWIEKYDIYYHALQGMFIAFIGPTFSEAMDNNMQLIVFLESVVILIILFWILIKTFFRKKINIYIFSLSFLGTFLILFGHYPFGVLNPGSAIRYRENFYAFLIIFLYYLYIKSRNNSFYKQKRI